MGAAKYTEVIIAVIAMMGSFGPVIALSNLSNNLNQTLASGESVLNLLEEELVVKDVVEGENVEVNIPKRKFSWERVRREFPMRQLRRTY